MSSHSTPIGSRLSVTLNDEYLRMQNEWFFKWHSIGRSPAVEIESFLGKPICYGGIKFCGSARTVYWDTIQRYLRKKIGSVFDDIEKELKNYPLDIRATALDEARLIVCQFAAKIRQAAIEKDRVLRGDGIHFPSQQNLGHWQGSQPGEIEARVKGLRRIYCDISLDVGGVEMPLESLQKDRVTLVKKDGTVLRSDIPAVVAPGQIITFAADLPIEMEDHLLRQLPNGLVEDYVVTDPGYMSGIAGAIAPHYQIKVRRSGAPVAPPQTIIANFHGPNSRLNVNSTDNSINIAANISREQLISFIKQTRANIGALPGEIQDTLSEPLALLEAEAASSNPSQTKVRTALHSIRAVVEGAAGNLVASGIASLIGRILSGQ